MANVDGQANYLYKNNGNRNHWLRLKLRGTISNQLAVGAKIYATGTIRGQVIRQLRVISTNARTCEAQLIPHFGLGDATQVDTLRIEWPSGIVQEIIDVPTNQILTVTEPPRWIPQGVGAFKIQCWINQSFDVKASTDLLAWANVATVTNTTGTLVFEDAEVNQHASRY